MKGEPRKYRRGHNDPYHGKVIRQPRDNGDGTYSIPLTKGHEATIDAADLSLVSGFNWSAVVSRKTVYASRAARRGDLPRNIIMHRVILDAPEDMQVDHIDGNGLNNTRANLRICTQAENMLNKSTYVNSPTGYRGVYPLPSGRFIARIRVDGKWINLGTYETAEEAAIERDKASIIHYGDFARLNVIERKVS